MKRKPVFAPRVEVLEDRLPPGSLFTSAPLAFGPDLFGEPGRSDTRIEGMRLPASGLIRADVGQDEAHSVSLVPAANQAAPETGRDTSAATVTGRRDATGIENTRSLDIGNNPFSIDILNEINASGHVRQGLRGTDTPAAARATEVGSPAVGGGTAPSFSPGVNSVAPAPNASASLPANFKLDAGQLTGADSGGTDPYTLYTHGDSYTPDGGLDRASFMAQYQNALRGLPPQGSDGGGRTGPATPGTPNGTPDPGLTGPYAVTTQEYTFGDTAFHPTSFPGPGVELTAEVKAPTNLPDTPLPLIILLHGRHSTTYNPTTNQAFLEWPPSAGRLSIPSYRGYDYLGDVLASQGYVVASISANGINAVDNSVNDLGAQARAELIQRHLDIWNDLSSGDGTVQPFGTAPFGTRFVGHVDLQNVGIMGHSRGGEGVVKSYLYNQSLGSPYGIRAVFALAPVDFNRPVDNNVPLAVLLPYNDGDVSDLQGAHFYDDARYNVPGDTGDKYTILVHGANHNFYNTVWTPGLFPAGAGDDGIGGPPARLTSAQERGTGLVSMAAFFRAYIGGETQFLPILRGDVAPPPSAQVTANQIYFAYHRADDGFRLDVNRLDSPGTLTTNTLGGAASGTGLVNYRVYGDTSVGEPQYIFGGSGEPGARFPHTVPSARSNRSGLSQLQVSYNAPGASYFNEIPAGYNDVSGFYALQFRAGVAFADPLNPAGQAQDFSVGLTDAEGDYASIPVSQFSNALYFPPGGPIHQILNTVRIPLSAYAYDGIDLTQVVGVRFDFDQRTSGSYLLDDLAFADPSTLYAGPYVKAASFSSSGGVVTFNTPIDPASFTTGQITITDPSGGTVPVTGITPDASSPGTRFNVSFQTTVAGNYTATIGPNITDLSGTPMDQNFNGIPGEATDTDVVTFTVTGGSTLLVNGGFETGDFTGWTTAIRSATSVGTINPAHSGTFAVDLGAVGSDDTFWQDVPTTPGQTYHISFWYYSDGGQPADFNVSWNGVNIYSEVNSPAHGYQQHTFDLPAGPGTTTRLLFGGRNDPTYNSLDDVSVDRV